MSDDKKDKTGNANSAAKEADSAKANGAGSGAANSAPSSEAIDPANIEALKELDAQSLADAIEKAGLHMGVTHPPGEMCADVARLSSEKSELVDQLQRLQAEFNNYRARVEREAAQAKEVAADKLLDEFLTINDNLTLALTHAKDEQGKTAQGKINGEDLLQGLLLIKDQMHQLIEHQGISEIPEDGAFNPHMHEALMIVAKDGVTRGQIVQTFQRGYKRGERVIRAAKVSVAK
jgi:molecular chaperone GrpE